MILTFTGTQQGMTPEQKDRVLRLMIIRRIHIQEIHVGGCIGADQEFYEMLTENQLAITTIWPSNIQSKHGIAVEHHRLHYPHMVQPEQPPLDRNKEMVNLSTHLLATPKEYEEELRSGTWATIRAAWKQRLVTTIILPNGKSF